MRTRVPGKYKHVCIKQFEVIRKIKRYTINIKDLPEYWQDVINKSPLEIVKELALDVGAYFKYITAHPSKLSPHYIVAHNGKKLELMQYLMGKTENKNPKVGNGRTPLHVAASCGHLDMFNLIFENVEEKFPGDNDGTTPFHLVALGGKCTLY